MQSYSIEYWGSTKISNIDKIQTLQSQSKRLIPDVPPYAYNETLREDLHIQTVKQNALTRYKNV